MSTTCAINRMFDVTVFVSCQAVGRFETQLSDDRRMMPFDEMRGGAKIRITCDEKDFTYG